VESRRLGVAGPRVSLVGLGCNNFGMKLDEAATRAVVSAALEAGVTHFDTAEVYGGGHSEEYLGRALGSRRTDVIVATKFAPRPAEEPYRPGVLRRRILEGCETSLRRLGTDYIDLYYQHRPDPVAPVGEALETLHELVEAGKVRHAGCSNYSAAQLDEAATAARTPGAARFVACQIHWSLLSRDVESEVVPAARRAEMGVVPYFPLEAGLLTGKYSGSGPFPPGSRLATMERYGRLATEGNFAYIRELSAFADGRGHTLLELAFAWLAAQESVSSIIAGATTPEQVRENVAAGQAWRLGADELAALPRRP
jgi:aryl-alcohol dehydrogenase-like predicted oxidoreductase